MRIGGLAAGRVRLMAALAPVLLLLASPASAFALSINENYQPQNEFKLDDWIPIKLGPIDLSINKLVLYLAIGCLLTLVSMLYVANRMQARPNKVQTTVEVSYGLMRNNIAGGAMEPKMAARWFPFVGTLFLFIWWSNMIGYIPLPTNSEEKFNLFGLHIPSLALYSATANISVTLILSLMVWLTYNIVGIRRQGLFGYFKSWVPSGVTGFAAVPLFMIEVISHFVRIISLSVRLFANILAGHLLILFMGGGLVVLLNLAVGGSIFLGLITGVMAIAFFIFEVGLVATLQAFIFATLTAIYLGGAVSAEH
jgi:F-type H+-transporting ATPase subunit a